MTDQRRLRAEPRLTPPHQKPGHDRRPLIERLTSDRNDHHARDQSGDHDRQREPAKPAGPQRRQRERAGDDQAGELRDPQAQDEPGARMRREAIRRLRPLARHQLSLAGRGSDGRLRRPAGGPAAVGARAGLGGPGSPAAAERDPAGLPPFADCRPRADRTGTAMALASPRLTSLPSKALPAAPPPLPLPPRAPAAVSPAASATAPRGVALAVAPALRPARAACPR